MPLFFTKLSHYFIIFGYLLIKKYGVLFDIINDFIIFSLEYYIHSEKLLFLVFIMTIKKTEIIFIVIYQNIFLN